MSSASIQVVRAAQLTNTDMKWGGQDRRVYCTDHLSPESAMLLCWAKPKAKCLPVNKGPCKHVWYKMGHVLTKVHDTAAVIKVYSLKDVDDLLEGRPASSGPYGATYQILRARMQTNENSEVTRSIPSNQSSIT